MSRVYPGSAAAGILQPGDRIIGLNGKLLDLTFPKIDLRKRLFESKSEAPPSLRVLRGDLMMELSLESEEKDRQFSNLLIKPADAVRELASLGRAIQYATLVIESVSDDQYAARLSLRFVSTDK